MTGAELCPGGSTLTIFIPLAIQKRGGKKQVVAPDGAPAWAPTRPQIDSTMVKALARAFRWRRLLEDGVYSTICDIAAAERINPSYVGRMLRLTLLAPDIVVAILDGHHPPELTMARLFGSLPVAWEGQAPALQWS